MKYIPLSILFPEFECENKCVHIRIEASDLQSALQILYDLGYEWPSRASMLDGHNNEQYLKYERKGDCPGLTIWRDRNIVTWTGVMPRENYYTYGYTDLVRAYRRVCTRDAHPIDLSLIYDF